MSLWQSKLRLFLDLTFLLGGVSTRAKQIKLWTSWPVLKPVWQSAVCTWTVCETRISGPRKVYTSVLDHESYVQMKIPLSLLIVLDSVKKMSRVVSGSLASWGYVPERRETSLILSEEPLWYRGLVGGRCNSPPMPPTYGWFYKFCSLY